MRTVLAVLAGLLLLGSVPAQACTECGGYKQVVLLPGLGNHHFRTSTQNPKAQKFFDQGLTLLYGFNHDEAVRSFRKAASLDPKLAMAHWGIALGLGLNYNMPATPENQKAAHEAVQKALALSGGASEPERDYIRALSKRYDGDPKSDPTKLQAEYKAAMESLVKKYPDDLDAATLYAESMMNLKPWQLWSLDGKPAEGTEEIISVLEGVLARSPDHFGALHFHIHAVEASNQPERGLASAHRLETLTPGAGHLTHMPGHIYMRIGDHESVLRSNRAAAKADEEYLKLTGAKGIYPMMYYSHNLHFLAVSASELGRHKEAMGWATKLADHIRPQVAEMPVMEYYLSVPLFVQLRGYRWDDLLKTPEPDAKLGLTRLLWRFGRGMAYAAKGQANRAEAEQKAFHAVRKGLPADAALPTMEPVEKLSKIADALLAARIALARSETDTALARLREGVAAEDEMFYMEPPTWPLPVRQSLGAALMAKGNSAEAETVFREDLRRNRRNARSLYGLRESLKAQGKAYAGETVGRELGSVWTRTDTRLSLGQM